MALIVWFTMGIALWHFTVFLPDRFWQGIVGAFLGSTIGAVVFGAIVEVASGRGLGETDVVDRADRDSRGRDRAGRGLGDRRSRRAAPRPEQAAVCAPVRPLCRRRAA